MQAQSLQTGHSPTSSSVANLRLVAVDPKRLGEVLPHIDGMLRSVVERHNGELSMAGILKKIASVEWILWLVVGDGVKAVLTTELYFDVGGAKRCRIPFCTGENAKTWVHLLTQLEAWARDEGCVKFDMIARKGWARHLPDYRMTHVVLEKDLT